MKSTLLALAAFGISTASAANSWAGSNLYFLQGLSDADQNTYLDNLQSAGAKVVRVWVNAQGSGCQKGINTVGNVPDLETTIGQYNDQTLDVLDAVLVKMQQRGLKALISPHDANMLDGSNGNDIYGQTWGSGDFYSSQDAFTAYDNRLAHILSYQGKTSGQTWGSWSDAIMGFDVQNEPMAPKLDVCTSNDPSGWLCGRAQFLRQQLGSNSNILIGTGGIGGDISHNCNFIQAAMDCDSVDMVSVHAYKGLQSQNPNQWSGAIPGWLSDANGKLLYVEEFGTPEGSNQPSDFTAQTSDIDTGAIPWIYWQILPPQECSSIGSDTYGVFQSGSVDWTDAVQQAASTQAQQDWSKVLNV